MKRKRMKFIYKEKNFGQKTRMRKKRGGGRVKIHFRMGKNWIKNMNEKKKKEKKKG